MELKIITVFDSFCEVYASGEIWYEVGRSNINGLYVVMARHGHGTYFFTSYEAAMDDFYHRIEAYVN